MVKRKIDFFWFTIATIGLAFILMFIFWRFVLAVSDPEPGLPADMVLGQTLYTGSGSGLSSTAMNTALDSYYDGSKYYVVDFSNNRVLVWNTLPTASTTPADIVLGQADMTSGFENRGGSATTSTLKMPKGVYADNTYVYVSEYGNNRVLVYQKSSLATGMDANYVLGQADFTTVSQNRGGSAAANSLRMPEGLYSDGTYLYVTDGGNHRVMIWDIGSITNGEDAVYVVGQPNFTTATSGTTDSKLFAPYDVHGDGNRLYVADNANNRVLIWNLPITQNGPAATRVLGQDNFTSGSANKGNGAVSSSSTLAGPTSVYSDGNNIYISDYTNYRVLIFTTTTPVSGSGADTVVGKSVFTDSTGYDVSQTTLNKPFGLYATSSYLYVGDELRNRVLRFNLTANSSTAPTVSTIGTSTISFSSVGTSTNFSFAQYLVYDNGASGYVTNQGTLAGSGNWIASSTWSALTLGGLTPGSLHVFRSQARYIAGVETGPSALGSNVYTLAVSAGTPSITSSTTSTVSLSWSTSVNHAIVTYAIYNSSTGQYVAADGTLGSTAVYQTTSTWGAVVTTTGMTPNTPYQFGVIARNGSNTDATTSTLSTAGYTLANSAGTPTSTVSSSSAITLVFDTNSNASSTTYALYNSVLNSYLSESGAPTSSPVYQTSSSWNGISAIGLSGNTAYQFGVIARNGSNINAATSTLSTAVYTLANIPSSVTASAGSTSIVLSWSGDATQYYAENSTASAMSGWISATSATFSGLTCGTSYSLKVKGKNVSGVETDFSSVVSATTAACSSSGGGSPIIISPMVLPANAATINTGEKETYSVLVTLHLNAPDAKEVALSNTADFANSSFLLYKPTFSWNLSPGYGKKTVYIKLRGKNGSVSTVSQEIILLEKAKTQPEIIPSEGATKSPAPEQLVVKKIGEPAGKCALVPGKAYKIRTSRDVWYITNDCTRKPMKNEFMYFTYFSSWKDLGIVSKENLQSVPQDNLQNLALGEKYIPSHGTFVRIPNDQTIYYVLGSKKIIIGSEVLFENLGYKKEWIEYVDVRVLDRYETLKTVNSAKARLDLTLIRYPNSSKVYVLEYGKKRHITNEQVLFNNRPFRFDRIIIVDESEKYPDGDPVV